MSTLTVPTGEFLEALNISNLTTAKEKDSILSNALVKVSKNGLIVESRNNILHSKRKIEAETEEEGKFMIEPGRLITIFKELKEDLTILSTNENTLTIKNGSFKTTIKVKKADNYPEYEDGEANPICNAEFSSLKQILKIASAYPDKNDTSKEYTGILLEFEGDKISAAATDHFRLINIVTPIECEKTGSFILESAMASVLLKINMEKNVKISAGEGFISVEDSKCSITSRLIKGEFPSYRSLLFSDDDNSIEVDRADMLSCIRRVSVISSGNDVYVEIIPEENRVMFVSINQEGEESEDFIEILNSGSASRIRMKLNYRFLTHFLSQITTETVRILYRSSEEPIMLKATDDRFTYNHLMAQIVE